MFLQIFTSTMLGMGIGLITLCSMGMPLLWVTMECMIVFSRIDLAFSYFMVENGKHLNKAKKHLLKLSIYFTDLPLCCCYNQRGENCVNLMIERTKFLFTNIEIYKYGLYQVMIGPIISYSTWWIMIVVAVNVALVGVPGWYLWNDSMFEQNKVVMGWNKHCVWMENG
eukprot:8357_1